MFTEVDSNASGSIGRNELRRALLKLGLHPDARDLEELVEVFDENNDGNSE